MKNEYLYVKKAANLKNARKWKAMAVGAAAALVVAAYPAAAQASNTSKATQGLLGTDVDDFMGPVDYSGVLGESDKVFAYLGDENSKLNLGVAHRLGGLYLGYYYNGTFVSGNGYDKTGVDISSVFDGDTSLWSSTTTTETYSGGTTNSKNSLDVLIGFRNMGVKVGFAEDLQAGATPFNITGTPSGTDTVYADGTRTVNGIVSDFSKLSGTMTPKVGWGMVLDVGGLTLKPQAGFSMDIHRDAVTYTKSGYTTYNGVQGSAGNAATINGKGLSTAEYGFYNGDSADQGNYLAPDIAAQLDVEKALGRGTLSAGLGYGINFKVYSSPSDADGGTVKGYGSYTQGSDHYINGQYTTDVEAKTATYTERSAMTHNIPLSVAYKLPLSERATVKAGLNLDFNIETGATSAQKTTTWYRETTTSRDPLSLKSSTTTTEYNSVSYTGQDTETSTFGVTPTIAVAGQVQLVPSKLTLNTGIGITPFTYKRTTTETKPKETGVTTTKTTDTAGVVTTNTVTVNPVSPANSSETYETSWTSYGLKLAAGLTFTVNNRFSLDAAAALTTTNSLKVNLWNSFVAGTYSFLITCKF